MAFEELADVALAVLLAVVGFAVVGEGPDACPEPCADEAAQIASAPVCSPISSRIDGQRIVSVAKGIGACPEKLGWEDAELGVTVRLGEPDLMNVLEGRAATPGNDGGGAPDERRGGTAVFPPSCSTGVVTTGACAFGKVPVGGISDDCMRTLLGAQALHRSHGIGSHSPWRKYWWRSWKTCKISSNLMRFN